MISETTGETNRAIARRAAAIACPASGCRARARRSLVVHPDGAEAARRVPSRALVQPGRPIYVIDAFQTGSAVAPRKRDAQDVPHLQPERRRQPRAGYPHRAGLAEASATSNWSGWARRRSGASSPPRSPAAGEL